MLLLNNEPAVSAEHKTRPFQLQVFLVFSGTGKSAKHSNGCLIPTWIPVMCPSVSEEEEAKTTHTHTHTLD